MKIITLGKTGIKTPQNGFGALPIQRVTMDEATKLLQTAYEGGMTFFDTARAYSDSEKKIGNALSDVRKNIYIASKSGAKDVEGIKKDLDITLNNLKTDYLDLYQFHCANQVYKPNDGTGMYELMEDLKRQGIIKHIGITAHKIGVANEAIESDLYETLQFPFSYLSLPKEIELVKKCKRKNIGFIAMKGLAGGLIHNSKVAMAFMTQFDNVLPIWGIQKMSELLEWLSYNENPIEMNDEIRSIIEADKEELKEDFCRGCGYCMPCPQGIIINQCARISLMLRRAPSEAWLSEYWQDAMEATTKCINCGACRKKCPYELNTPELLKKNYADYQKVLQDFKGGNVF